MEKHSDDKKRAKESNLNIGDTVFIQQTKRTKFTTKYDPKPFTAVSKRGTFIKAERDNQKTRNASFFKTLSLQDKGNYDNGNYYYDDYHDYDDSTNKRFDLNIKRHSIRN